MFLKSFSAGQRFRWVLVFSTNFAIWYSCRISIMWWNESKIFVMISSTFEAWLNFSCLLNPWMTNFCFSFELMYWIGFESSKLLMREYLLIKEASFSMFWNSSTFRSGKCHLKRSPKSNARCSIQESVKLSFYSNKKWPCLIIKWIRRVNSMSNRRSILKCFQIGFDCLSKTH